ncbi:MAG: IS21 family transposase [Pirellulales bacterium]|nr:IS21 family transposase [Pirellulales bacterium]
MKFYRKAESAARAILEAFRCGSVPKAMAPVFIRRKDNVPCRSWSNQMIAALFCGGDARGYRQWQEVGRQVKKGEKAAHILVPLVGKRSETDAESGQTQEQTFLYGFTSAPVFGLHQTEGAPLPPPDPEVMAWLENLPLVEVARSWGLSIDAYNGRPGAPLGKYRGRQGIALGVENLATWAHEMCHAAGDRLGNLTERGQHWRSETVAELGGAILLEILGHETHSDRGGCFEYVKAYADAVGIEPMAACQRVLNRTCDAVALILGTAAPVIDADGKRCRPWVFRIILSHSRKGYSEAVYRQTTEAFVQCLENAFHYFGGVPRRLVIDNLKAAVSRADWYDPEIHPKLQSLAEHYGTIFVPTKAYTPRHKGKVERGVDYVQENGLKGRQFSSLEEENRHLLDWEANVADTRIHGTTRKQVGGLLESVERPALLELPPDRFPSFQEATRKVHRDGYIAQADLRVDAHHPRKSSRVPVLSFRGPDSRGSC